MDRLTRMLDDLDVLYRDRWLDIRHQMLFTRAVERAWPELHHRARVLVADARRYHVMRRLDGIEPAALDYLTRERPMRDRLDRDIDLVLAGRADSHAPRLVFPT